MTAKRSHSDAMADGSRLRVRRRSIFSTLVSVLAIACFGFNSAPTSAQPTNNDYYKGAGTELLYNVEKYHLGPANDKLRSRQYESGQNEIAFMLRYFPNHPQALMLLTELCEQWKSPRCNPQEAFESAIAVNPNAAGTFIVQGIYLYRVKQFPAAIASLEKALTMAPDSVNAHYNLGLAYFETKQYDLSNEHAQRAYQLGAPLPGLRDKLTKVGRWKAVDAPKSGEAPPNNSGAQSSAAPR